MMLLSDGGVMVHGGGGGASNAWYRLSPDSSGNYINGSWSTLTPMGTGRLYFTSDVLPSGKVFLLGGEYSSQGGLTNTGEMYDPVSNTWSTIASFPNSNFGDDPSEVMPDGRVLAGYIFGPQTYLYNPTTNTWSSAGTKLNSDRSDEETWTKLPDGSILSYDIFASDSSGIGSAQRYVPATNQWVATGTVPVALSSDAVGSELGPGLLLPDGRVFLLGATGNTAYYTPSTNSWTAGPPIPNGLASGDAPAAMLPNGHVLLAASPPLANGNFPGPTTIFEFDPLTNTYLNVTPNNISLSNHSFTTGMLVLPTGQVALVNDGGRVDVYTAVGSPSSAWKPTITNVVNNGGTTYTLTGTQLNGISEGASYGDDAEMSSNYPLVKLTSQANGTVYFARTFNWSSTGVATGNTPVSVQFKLPSGIPFGSYNLTVVANGIASDPVTLPVPPTVVSINRAGPAETANNSVQYTVTFNEAVTGVDASDFHVTTTGSLTAPTPVSVLGSGASYLVTVSNLHGSGDLRLDLIDNDSIAAGGVPLAGVGNLNGSFLGQTYSVEQVSPFVESINRANPSTPTASGPAVSYTVTFNEPVTGVDASDFSLVLGGSVSAASPVVVTGSGATYTVTISGVSGVGTLGLNLIDDGTIRDPDGNRLVQGGLTSTFASQTVLTTGANPKAVAMADLNGDGIADLVVANSGSNTIGVFLGSGNGTFSSQTTYAVGLNPVSLALADLNGDGKPDVVVANQGSNSLSVLLGNGNGTFQPQATVATGPGPVSVAVADLSGDGKPDLAVADQAGGSVSVHFGNGDGTFALQTLFSTGSGSVPTSIALADINGDSRPDLLVGDSANSWVAALLNQGNGTFSAFFPNSTGGAPAALGVLDANGDGNPDLVAANQSNDTLGVLLGTQGGTFPTHATYATGASPQSVTAADLNGDGKPDLVAANSADNTLSVLLGDGDGTFAPQMTLPTGAGPDASAAADVNGDGRIDLAVANATDNSVSVLVNTTNGTFTGQTYTIAPAPVVESIDRASPASATTSATSVSFAVTFSQSVTGVDASDFRLTTSGSVVAGSSPPVVSGSGSTYTVTINGVQGSGSLRLDLVDDDSIQSSLGIPLGGVGVHNGSFQGQSYSILQVYPRVESIARSNPASSSTSASTVSFTVTFNEPVTGVDASDFALAMTGTVTATTPVDVTGSGAIYTVTVNNISGIGTLGLNLLDDGTIRDAAGNGLTSVASQVSFEPQATYAAGADPFSVAMGDLNGDGIPDAVVANSGGGNISVLRGVGDASFLPQTLYGAGLSPISVALADVNGDGNLDAIVVDQGSNSLSLLLGNGDGTFQSQSLISTGASPASVAVADLNGDGKPDLVVANQGSDNVSVLLGNGDGTFQPQALYPAGSTPASVAVADLNGDGIPDLVVANEGDSNVGVLLGSGDGTFQPPNVYSTDVAPVSVAVADVDGDGNPDIVVANLNNDVSVLLGNGNGTLQDQVLHSVGNSPSSLAVADLNGDGRPDVAVVNTGDDTVGALLGGAFSSQLTFATDSSPESVAVADLNGDGRPDLVVANDNSDLSVLVNAPNGGFTGQAYSIVQPPVLQLSSNTDYTTAWTDAGAVAIASNTDASLVDSESSTLDALTVTLAAPQAGDVLSATPTGGISVVPYNSTTGVLLLTGADTAADYLAALKSITYDNSLGGPHVLSESITVVANDGIALSNTATATVGINTPPVVQLNAPKTNYTTTFTGAGAVAIASNANASITDGESTTLGNMTVTLSTHVAGDTLSATGSGGVTVTAYNSTTGVLLLSGSASLSSYLTVLKTVTYNNTSGGPALTTETVNVQGNDGTASSNVATTTINIATAPIVELNGPAVNWTNPTAWPATDQLTGEAHQALHISNGGTATIITAAISTLQSMTVTLASPSATNGDYLLGSPVANITVSGYNRTTGQIIFTGSDTPANYLSALNLVLYNNSNIGGQNKPTETVTVVVNDGVHASNTAAATLTISQPPAVKLNINTKDYSTIWTNGGAVPISGTGPAMGTGSLGNFPVPVITDAEAANLSSMTVSIASVAAGDVLTFNAVAGITGAYNSVTGVAAFTGSASLASYQTELASVRYNNTSGGPGVGSVAVTVVTNDGSLASTAATASITVNTTGTFNSLAVGEYLFYDHSTGWDNVIGPAAVASSDNRAIDPTKVPYLGTSRSSGASLSGYTNGLNGIMLDLTPHSGTNNHASLTLANLANDFTFRVSGSLTGAQLNNPAGFWTAAPAPNGMTVRLGGGAGGSDRVEITWADGAIKNQWLEVTAKASTDTGLGAPVSFFFGDLVGDTGDGNGTNADVVSGIDEIDMRLYSGATPNPVYQAYDVNKDRAVDATDQVAARNNSSALRNLIINPANFAPDTDPSAATSSVTTSSPDINSITSALAATTTSASSPAPATPPTWQSPIAAPSTPIAAATAQVFEALASSDLAEQPSTNEAASLDEDLVDSLLADLGLR